jgi:hypothetical protein
MKLLLPALREYLKRELVDPTGTISLVKPLRLVANRPAAWIAQNHSSVSYPGVFLWEDTSRDTPGPASNTLTTELNVVLVVYMQSSDANAAAFHDFQGIFPLSDRIKQLLYDNKQVKDANGIATVTGLKLPMDIGSGALVLPLKGQSTFLGVAREFHLHYVREGESWHEYRNDENVNYIAQSGLGLT